MEKANTSAGSDAPRDRARQRWKEAPVYALLLAMACLLATGVSIARAQEDTTSASAIEGDWLVKSRDAIIRIERRGNQYEGRIVWQLHETYGPEDGPELNGKIVTDRNNPDPAMRSVPLTGLRLVWGLHYDADRQMWVHGRVYDANNGKTYRCLVRLLDHDKLSLRGYIGISLLGRSTTWTRTRIPVPASAGTAGDAR